MTEQTPTPAGVWFTRQPVPGPNRQLAEVLALTGPRPTDVANGAEERPRVLAAAVTDLSSGHVVRLRVDQALAPSAPALWYASLPEPDAVPAATSLVAFGTDDCPAGAVVDAWEFTDLPVRSNDQCAAVRWYPETGQVHQVYVAPEQRRRGIATTLLVAAGVYAVAQGWPVLWGTGDRTDLGEALVSQGAQLLRTRVLPRTSVLPPMTPMGPARSTGG